MYVLKSKTVKNALIILGLILFLSACKKDNQPKFIDKPSDELVKYVIELSCSEIIEYSKYINNEFVEVTKFYNSDSVIEVIRKNEADEVIYKTIYHIGTNGLAETSVSSIGVQGLDIYQSNYKYADGFWVERNSILISNEDSIEVYITRTIENENVTRVKAVVPSGCTNRYGYNNEINKIDLNFSNGITGKWNKNLVEHASWQNGCPCGPSSSIAASDYKYELDSDGYVTKMIETYTPCYHVTDPGTVTRTISTTLYEYHLN